MRDLKKQWRINSQNNPAIQLLPQRTYNPFPETTLIAVTEGIGSLRTHARWLCTNKADVLADDSW